MFNIFKKQKEELFYKLRIDFSLNKESFEAKNSNSADLNFIMELGDLIRFSKYGLGLGETKLITKSGLIISEYNYLKKFHKIPDLHPYLYASLTLNENEVAMNRLKHAFERKEDNSKDDLKVKLKYKNGLVQTLYTKQGKFYVDLESQILEGLSKSKI